MQPSTAESLIGESSSFIAALEKVSRLAAVHKPVLIIGERGTGKELFAARLHYLSPRWQHQYVTLNCAALNENLLESELFGYEAGAFTGASKRRLGRFEMAHEGTLFLDEIGNTSTMVQEKLLRVIEYGEFERVGGNQKQRVNTRIIAATNEDLPALATRGAFRADLLDRLAFDVVTVPPLRHRRDDILKLADYFAVRMTKELQRPFFAGFTPTAIEQLIEYPWPGNVRELKNVVERAVYALPSVDAPISDWVFDPFDSVYRPVNSTKYAPSDAAAVATPVVQESTELSDEASCESGLLVRSTANAVVTSTQANTPQYPLYPLDFKTAVAEFETHTIQTALEDHQFNQKKTASALKLTYHQLRGYLKKYQFFEQS